MVFHEAKENFVRVWFQSSDKILKLKFVVKKVLSLMDFIDSKYYLVKFSLRNIKWVRELHLFIIHL